MIDLLANPAIQFGLMAVAGFFLWLASVAQGRQDAARRIERQRNPEGL